jgi:hypothetical protein
VCGTHATCWSSAPLNEIQEIGMTDRSSARERARPNRVAALVEQARQRVEALKRQVTEHGDELLVRGLQLASPGGVAALAADALRKQIQTAPRSAAKTTASPRAAPTQRAPNAPQKAPRATDLRQEIGAALHDIAERKLIQGARTVGNVVGVGRGAVHAVKGVADTAQYLVRLADPMDGLKSPPGMSARELTMDAVKRGGKYLERAYHDPSIVVEAVKRKAHEMRQELDPNATPEAATLSEEMRRNFDVGMNQGELGFEVGSFAFGGPLAKGVSRIGALGRPTVTAARYIKQGFSPKVARYLAEPYKGMGSHYIPRRAFKKNPSLPKALKDSEFNVLQPHNITRGEMYELHAAVDPSFSYARIPARHGGGGWNANALNVKRYGVLGRRWHGAPGALKARIGGTTAALGGLSQDFVGDD